MVAESLSGNQAESLACTYLQRAGLVLVARNYRCRQGELDLVMDEQGTLVFIEVRYRRSAGFGSPAESVHAHKRLRLVAAARHYLLENTGDQPCRFDVVAISGDEPYRIDWIRDAFQATGEHFS